MKFLPFLFILIPLGGLAQQNQVTQLKSLLEDLRNDFAKSKGTVIPIDSTSSGFTSYSSKSNLEGSIDNKIDIGKTWASYTAFISDSCRLKEAKRLSEFWKEIASIAAPNYTKSRQDGKHKTFSGHPVDGYYFEVIEDRFQYWIDISFAKRPLNNGYSVILILGKQLQL